MLILAIVALAGLAAFALHLARSTPDPEPLPDPALRTLADWRREHELVLDAEDRTRWMDCACCGAPTFHTPAGCDLCGAEDGGSPEEMRARFRQYGTVHTPEEMASWAELPPGDEEVALVNSILDLCDSAPAGRPGYEFWERFHELRDELQTLRDARIEASQQAYAARLQEREAE